MHAAATPAVIRTPAAQEQSVPRVGHCLLADFDAHDGGRTPARRRTPTERAPQPRPRTPSARHAVERVLVSCLLDLSLARKTESFSLSPSRETWPYFGLRQGDSAPLRRLQRLLRRAP